MTTSKREDSSSVDHHRSKSHRHSNIDRNRSSSPQTITTRKHSETGTDNDKHRRKSRTNEKSSSKYRHSSSTSNQNFDKKHHRKPIDEPRRKSSYDRRHDYHRHYRSPSPRYHHHHHSRHHRRPHRSRYSSSSSSSFSSSSRSRTTSSSRTSTSYSSISRTSSSRSSSRRHRRSPTLEKLFLKASESIEAISTQRDPNATTTTTTHLIPIQTLPTESNTFYSEHFTGFSVPPPPFIPQQHQRYLKEITTDSSTTATQEFLTNNRPTIAAKPPRVSRFSDITTTAPIEPVVLNTNLPVDTVLNYAQISDNINCLSSSRRQQKRHNREVMECECTTSEYDRSRGIKACGTECLNRMLLIECSSNCPCGQFCTNRRFQKRSYASHKLALFKTEMKGHGLRTMASIRKGRFLVEYVGEVVDMDELARRSKKYKRDGNIHQYVMSLIHGTVIDSTIKGNWARFINHSCEPNCVAEKWLVNGEYRMGIFAKRDLEPNEEITIDYRFESFGSTDLANEKCYCGAQTCRGTISIKTNQNNNNSTKRQTRRQAIDDDELIEYLQDDETNEYIIPKTIEEIRQLIQIMSRTDSENVRTIELDLIRTSSQKHFELPRLFLECNGLHVLCSWMKDILIDNDQQQDYSIEFKINLLDFIQNILPIKDRTIVKKNGLLELVHQKLQLPIETTTTSVVNDQQQIQNLLDQMLDHLDNPITSKLFHLYSTWMSLKERFIIPKRKEPEPSSSHHHRHHHHHSSKSNANEENSSRFNFNTRPTMSQLKPIERYSNRRTTYNHRDLPRSHEQDERRKLFEQQYEDAEKARAAAAAAANGESPGENEPPNKKQRTSEGSDPTASNTPAQLIDQTSCIHQYLSQIPLEYIQSYMSSISDSNKDEPSVPPPARPEDEAVLSRMIRLPAGWSVAMCPSDSSVYFYNKETMTSTWLPPAAGADSSTDLPLDLSPLSSAQITEQRRPSHRSKHLHRHVRTHRHHLSNSNKRKRPSENEFIGVEKEISHEQEEQQDNIDESINNEMSTTVKSEDQSTNSLKVNRDLLRKNISQYVHSTLKPYTKRTCKQGRIATTEDIKYLVKKFTLAVLDKEIEKAKNDRIALSTVLTDRVRLKTELYVKKYMNKMGPVFQRHESTTTTAPSAPENGTSTTTNPE